MKEQPWRFFAFKLAALLGVWDVDAMLEEMPANLLSEWAAFWALDPQGPIRTDAGAASVVSIIANILRSKNDKPLAPVDVMPDWSGERKEKAERVISNDELREMMRSFASRGAR